VGFVVDKVALGQVLSEYFGFPYQSSFQQIAPQSSSSIIWGLYNRPEVAAVPNGLSSTPPIIIIIIIICSKNHGDEKVLVGMPQRE
jgi:hypothetical protein